jgi:hypothetical protein
MPRRLLSAPTAKFEEWDRIARRSGKRWSQWARSQLDQKSADIRSLAGIRPKRRRESQH